MGAADFFAAGLFGLVWRLPRLGGPREQIELLGGASARADWSDGQDEALDELFQAGGEVCFHGNHFAMGGWTNAG